MARKENKGGILRNDQVERDLEVKGKTPGYGEPYSGSQDTGDSIVRSLGNDVQQRDGQPPKEQNEEN